jgi:hypothetical protein
MSDAFFMSGQYPLGTKEGRKKFCEIMSRSNDICERHTKEGDCKSCNPHRRAHATSCWVRLFDHN